MAILWCGGEDIDFPIGSITIQTGSYFRSTYARCALGGAGGNSAQVDLRSTVFSGGGITSGWLSGRMGTNTTGYKANRMLGLVSSGSGNFSGIYAGTTLNTNQLVLIKFDGTTSTVLATESGASLTAAFAGTMKIDLQIISFGASATLNLYANNSLAVTYTGSTTISGVSSLDSVCIHDPGNSGGGAMAWSEMIVADEDTRTLSLAIMAPTGTGTTDSWTGAFGTVSEVTLDDTTYISTNTVSQDEQFNVTDLPTGSFAVRAVKAAARAESTISATVTKIGLGVKNGATIDSGTLQTLTSGWATYERLMTQDPTTSANWAQADMNGLQVNLRSGS